MTPADVHQHLRCMRQSLPAQQSIVALAEQLTESPQATGDLGYAVSEITNSPGKDADGDDLMLSATCQPQFTQSLPLFVRQSHFEPHILPPTLPMYLQVSNAIREKIHSRSHTLLHLPRTLANGRSHQGGGLVLLGYNYTVAAAIPSVCEWVGTTTGGWSASAGSGSSTVAGRRAVFG
ncbi:hypothetical protein BV22DRAFT_927056 [Leucogyrophana mollusca]|uniref:Uncharacterized protein n=1 Tax=Leucogyrophana mollusca TaxID=85980 RepID=A0ACB8AX54_9AGAM|nr:hypothetical protein BV22DRAFT_927056 [Leucogyrophana mollusca]